MLIHQSTKPANLKELERDVKSAWKTIPKHVVENLVEYARAHSVCDCSRRRFNKVLVHQYEM
jgi:hypothetical protein